MICTHIAQHCKGVATYIVLFDFCKVCLPNRKPSIHEHIKTIKFVDASYLNNEFYIQECHDNIDGSEGLAEEPSTKDLDGPAGPQGIPGVKGARVSDRGVDLNKQCLTYAYIGRC